jgi:hypothetical protein
MQRPATIAIRCKFLENSMSTSVKLLNPRNADTKYIGLEPDWQRQPAEHERQSLITRAFNFYNYFYNQKNAKEMIVTWLTANKRKKDLEIVNRIPDNDIIPTLGWICRMNTVGLELTESETKTLEKLLQDQITVYRQRHQKQEQKKAKGRPNEPVTAAAPITIQDRLREKISECAGDIEGSLDDFIANKCRQVEKFSPLDLFRSRNLSPQLIGLIAQTWRAKKAELEQVQKARDSQLVEGYSNFNKTELKNLIKFADQVINDCASYVQIKKVERKPRVKKPVSTEKIIAKFRYLKNFSQFKLVSESPTKLVNASEAWLFDTKKRKLIHVVADSHSGSFTVKNNSIIGFDAAQSQQKTLRKPAEQLKSFMSSAKPAMRKIFKDIKSVETKFNGRSSEDMVILKVW